MAISVAPEPIAAPTDELAGSIADAQQALEAARQVAIAAAPNAALRDRQRQYPLQELALFSRLGLGGISIPREYGGPGLSFVTLAEVFRLISAVDPALGQIPQNHFGLIQLIRDAGSEEQKRRIFAAVLAGQRIGNGGPEKNSKHTLDMHSRLRQTDDGLRFTGDKFYSTGALFAHIVAAKALDDQQRPVLALIPRPAAGLEIVDDWSGIGQRTTASGTVRLREVRVDPANVIPLQPLSDKPTIQGAVSQLIQAAIDAGIAQGALDEAAQFIRERSRPWVDAGVERNAEDPYILADVGRLSIELSAANALLRRAARVLDETDRRPIGAEDAAAASIAVAEAKVLTTEVALQASEKLFEWSGSRATLAEHGLDRHWRNARTHTLHDPVRWKYHAIGDYYLNGRFPARHSWI
ncbi:Flavin-dependent monooxygenase, oxygenase subunit HsaA [Serratia entomophila]|uniref:SfnB family sulfur acquisition oxidoreductase n=1 Tax=Serratia entomophila TaxID=42906 RepID=UPI001F3F4A0C|nr:SfnB family sulfur acquisition oxidoreductase [Serratia entomophila]UIW16253.1 SfnB family sulfur acquisition oxidoreductase [Serratia entomophila]CAI0708691.1 Flavin-dependent monooxygenase, oxygenase subunit HsaA [Serratia entomophila]CAI0855597.1 Flavin-dependent monooxygenase, oxygenase subunit HsaA [Serratia entomophila]CAI0872237.1 Flavin-dependent monooxygenase, oxygenase subunit HsaA [Serratia entomophila]CAI0891740.1 Flavin-dependent monooxygenase, oxygenase subunit HsaA [Serratia 